MENSEYPELQINTGPLLGQYWKNWDCSKAEESASETASGSHFIIIVLFTTFHMMSVLMFALVNKVHWTRSMSCLSKLHVDIDNTAILLTFNRLKCGNYIIQTGYWAKCVSLGWNLTDLAFVSIYIEAGANAWALTHEEHKWQIHVVRTQLGSNPFSLSLCVCVCLHLLLSLLSRCVREDCRLGLYSVLCFDCIVCC